MSHPPRNWRSLPALTLTEAAAVLGVSRSRAYEMAQAGKLATHLDHMSRRRVLPADLEPLLAAQADDQPNLFAQDRPSGPETRHAPTTPPKPRQAAAQVPPEVPEHRPPTAAFQAARAALKQARRGAR